MKFIYFFFAALLGLFPLFSVENKTQDGSDKIDTTKYIIKDFENDPRLRAEIFESLDEITTDALIFSELFKKVDPACIFPTNGDYTIFIPYNRAVTNGILKILEKLRPEELCLVLSHFVVNEKISLYESAEDTIEGKERHTTIAGSKFDITKKDGIYHIGSATILLPFAIRDKGVSIHLINRIDYIDVIMKELSAGKKIKNQTSEPVNKSN